MRARLPRCLLACWFVLSSAAFMFNGAAITTAGEAGHGAFGRVWARTDQPVADLAVSRTWMWGPQPNGGVLQEKYVEGPGGMRDVQYYDKSRMEITDPAADSAAIWYVTNGLLVVELISGMLQVGHDAFVEGAPADVVVAGDLDDASGPTYATFTELAFPDYTVVSATGATVTQRISRVGTVSDDPALAERGVTLGYFDDITGHNIAGPFWDFMNSSGLVLEDGELVTSQLFLDAFYATGRPVIEPYWATVKVAGTPQDVLMQCFERRCLTYTPLNDPGWQVEAGNVGLHYEQWRYDEPEPPGDPADLRINEVLFLPEAGGVEWVDLYNAANAPIELADMRLTNGDGSRTVLLPVWTIPSGAHLVVYFGAGNDDSNFSDGTGSFYAGAESAPFFSSSDAALYNGAPSSDSILDFLSWAYFGDYTPGVAHNHAVAAGSWPQGSYFEANGNLPLDAPDYIRRHLVMPGESIGRDRTSTDTNAVDDWDVLGGADALDPTPGSVNESAFLDEVLGLLDGSDLAAGRSVAGAPDLPLAQKKWTIMIYWDSSSSLSRPNMKELLTVTQLGSDANVNIVFLMAGGSISTRAYLEGGALHHIDTDTSANPGDPAKLSGFITWSKTNLPAEHYAIVLSGHGLGWKGLFPNSATTDFLTMSELDTGLAALGVKFDVVKFDACLMGNIEVGYQIADRADYMTASEQVSWGHFPWQKFINDLKANSGWNGGQVADSMANLHADKYDEFIASPNVKAASKVKMSAYTWASIDLAELAGTLVPAVSAFAGQLLQDVEEIHAHDFRDDNGQIVIKDEGRIPVKEYHDTNFIDLYRFAELIGGTLLETADLAPPVQQAVDDAVRVMRKGSGAAHANSHGLSIYFPRTLLLPNQLSNATVFGPDTAVQGSSRGFSNPHYDPRQQLPTSGTHLYKLDANILIPALRGQPHPMEDDPDFAFPRDTAWDEFLHRYYKPVADACIRVGNDCVLAVEVEVGDTVTLSGNGSSDSDGPEGPLNDEPAHVGGHQHYYWDMAPSEDSPAPLPDYQTGVLFPTCTEDCDRDEIDDLDDDPDSVGKIVQFTCPRPGVYPIRMVVWDEHHDQGRVRYEDKRHNNGRHWLHFNVDDAWVTVSCGEPPKEPVKKASSSTVGPGEDVVYTITVFKLEDTALGWSVTDALPESVTYVEGTLECSAGACEYDPESRTIFWEGQVAADVTEITEVAIAYMVSVPTEVPPGEPPPGVPPPEIVNCATGTVNDVEFESCVTVEVELPST